MPADVVVGMQWGDEGKGKVVDFLAGRYHAVVRYGGGSNAGHTVYLNKEVADHVGKESLVFHLLPSGVLYEGKSNVLADGMVVDPEVLAKEITGLKEKDLLNGNLHVSDRIHLTLPHYYAIEEEDERLRGSANIGTTRQGVGPTYAFFVNRAGIRLCDLADETSLRERMSLNIKAAKRLLPQNHEINIDALVGQLMKSYEAIAPYVTDTSFLIHKWLSQGRDVLFEGAQGTHLDVMYGTYPYVTSSHPTVGGVSVGAGVPATWVRNVFGVAKAYPTRVGRGVLPTKMEPELAHIIRDKAQEYGATTGRPRDIGWPDHVALRYAKRINGVTQLVVTRLDILDGLNPIKVANSYRLDGRVIDETNEPFPASGSELEKCEPVYGELPGWEEETFGVTDYSKLPDNARRFIERMEEELQLHTGIISTGPRRHETIVR
ncbi:MAG: adenylosuccinate synthase [Candidatus Aenigmarchaeota archaeon]|nr:adenylosuccinate synthase [Candidatus Aenigmarchaeota archaeon]